MTPQRRCCAPLSLPTACALLVAAALLSVCTAVCGAASGSYQLSAKWDASNWVSDWFWFTYDDPTHGTVRFVDSAEALRTGLLKLDGGTVRMGVDTTNVVARRPSIRLQSYRTFTTGLFILDATHFPGQACGSWPAFWSAGPNWPASGEIDAYEGVNMQKTNLMSLHTTTGCTVSGAGSKQSTTLSTGVCSAPGCSLREADAASYGNGFNAAGAAAGGGGVYAYEWTSSHISVWYFARGSIPGDVTAGRPDPSTWPTPSGRFSSAPNNGGCDLSKHFKDHTLIFDITFCGDWAGSVWGIEPQCKGLANSCADFVANNPAAFKDVFWNINSLKAYSFVQATTAAPTPAPTTTAAPQTTKAPAPVTQPPTTVAPTTAAPTTPAPTTPAPTTAAPTTAAPTTPPPTTPAPTTAVPTTPAPTTPAPTSTTAAPTPNPSTTQAPSTPGSADSTGAGAGESVTLTLLFRLSLGQVTSAWREQLGRQIAQALHVDAARVLVSGGRGDASPAYAKRSAADGSGGAEQTQQPHSYVDVTLLPAARSDSATDLAATQAPSDASSSGGGSTTSASVATLRSAFLASYSDASSPLSVALAASGADLSVAPQSASAWDGSAAAAAQGEGEGQGQGAAEDSRRAALTPAQWAILASALGALLLAALVLALYRFRVRARPAVLGKTHVQSEKEQPYAPGSGAGAGAQFTVQLHHFDDAATGPSPSPEPELRAIDYASPASPTDMFGANFSPSPSPPPLPANAAAYIRPGRTNSRDFASAGWPAHV